MRERQFSLLRFSRKIIRRVSVEDDVCSSLCNVGINVKAEFQAIKIRTRWIADKTAFQIILWNWLNL